MLRNRWLKRVRESKGAALVEFALIAPLLLILCMAATDFGRLFYDGVTVANAAATGAFHGGQDHVAAAQTALIEQRALDDAKNITGVSATKTAFCECPASVSAPTPTPIACTESDDTTACAGYGAPKIYVQVDVAHTFQTLGPWPMMRQVNNLGRRAFMRVQ